MESTETENRTQLTEEIISKLARYELIEKSRSLELEHAKKHNELLVKKVEELTTKLARIELSEKAKLKYWMTTEIDGLKSSSEKIEETTKMIFEKIMELESKRDECASLSGRNRFSSDIQALEQLSASISSEVRQVKEKAVKDADVLFKKCENMCDRSENGNPAAIGKQDNGYVTKSRLTIEDFMKTLSGRIYVVPNEDLKAGNEKMPTDIEIKKDCSAGFYTEIMRYADGAWTEVYKWKPDNESRNFIRAYIEADKLFIHCTKKNICLRYYSITPFRICTFC